MKSRAGSTFFAFNGVPYAQPPLGELRFQPPQPVKPWKGVLSAQEETPICMQMSVFDLPLRLLGVEDCLHLSIFTKNLSGNSPVLVHFHGGGYTAGSKKYYGPQYLLDEDMVVVDMNYRLGILGFLSFETPEMPGNQGVKDQVEALRWVQKYITFFGGNPNLVTLTGESAGGSSVYNHILSPLSKGLFHRAVPMSGVTSAPWAIAPPGFRKTRGEKLLNMLDCPPYEKNGLQCLLKKNASEIVSKFVKFLEWQIDPCLNFGPVLEPPGPGAFLPGSLNSLEHNPVPLMMGLSSAEGFVRTIGLLAFNTDFNWYTENFDKLAPMSLLYFATASKPDELTPKIRNFYLPKEKISLDDWVNLTMMYSDAWFNIDVIDGADSHTGDVYLYYVDYIMQGDSVFPLKPEFKTGAYHGSEAALIWNLTFAFVPNIINDFELSLSKKYIKFLTTFMNKGYPVSDKDDIRWTKWTKKDHNYLHITKEGFNMEKDLLNDRYKFWKTLNYRDNHQKGFHER